VTLSAGQEIGHYRLVEKIGEGGMGVIWKALDTELGRDVALKFLPESLAGDAERLARFKREATTLARMNHPNIVTIHSIEESGGVRFLTMELVEGQTLSDCIPEGGMGIARLLELAIPLADALSSAHERGITHRDLKPANVMVDDDGRVKVLDFGLAKVRQDRGSLDASRSETGVTREGDLVGTIRYMAPEQLDGQPADARSDIFSMGVILYEMATGGRPFHGAGLASLMSSILNDDPPPMSGTREDLPGDLGRIARHCLQKDPEQRYQTAKGLRNELTELAADLATGRVPRVREAPVAARPWKWILTAAVLVAAIAGAWNLRGLLTGTATDAPAVLVLPFEARGQQEGGGMLGLSVAEAVAVDLAPAENLRVLPVDSKAGGGDPIEVARREECRYVVTGSVRRSGSDVSLSIQLIDARAGELLSGSEVSGPDARLATLAAGLAREVGNTLGARFGRTYGMVAREVQDPELRVSAELGEFRSAYQAVDTPRLVRAASALVAAYPTKPEAQAVEVYARVLQAEDDPSPDSVAALEDSLRSLERLDPQSPYIDFGLAWLARSGSRPHEALQRYSRLVERADLTPAYRGWMLRLRSQVLIKMGDDDRALEDAREALDLDPANPWAFTTLSMALSRVGQHEGALEMARRAVGLRPGTAFPHVLVGMALLNLGQPDGAIEALTRSTQETKGSWQYPFACLALALRVAERHDEAEAMFARAAAMPDVPDGTFVLARERALAGHRAEALALLRRARDVGFIDRAVATVPELRPLHGDPEFEAIRREVEDIVK
jgi:TolB-like protein/tetratricopeptide (TPR) repeat protein